MGLCKKFQDGRIPPELLEAGVQIFSRYWQGYLVHFITGFPRVATYLKSKASLAILASGSGHSPAAVLLNDVTHLGMIQVKASDGFGIVNRKELGRILNSMTSCIALAHPNVPTLPLIRQTILDIPSHRSNAAGGVNNENYKRANSPIFYVGNRPCKSANAVFKLLGGNTATLFSVCRALRERFFQQETNEPIRTTAEERQMLGGQSIVCRIERIRGGPRRARR